MKQPIIQLLTILALAFPAFAEEKSDLKKPGPNGGRVIGSIEPPAEFFITKDRKVQISFLGPDGKVMAPAGQTVTVTAGERSAPITLKLVRSGDVLVSEDPLPKGNNFPTVVQIKVTPDANAVYERFTFDASKCAECNLPEYACICSH